MIITALIILGLCLGSFVNALVWRVHEQEKPRKKSGKAQGLSILKGRSMCPNCRHELSAMDLVPVVSWLALRGKCRYCKKPISWLYPIVELSTMILFLGSYLAWPYGGGTTGTINFAAWLIVLTGLTALVVYDFRWMLLPNRIVYPLTVLAATLALFNIVNSGEWNSVFDVILSVAVAGGIFYGLFVLSNGRWIGGGDVKLGFLLGLLLADPLKAFMMLLGASLLGTVVILPGLATKKLTAQSKIPFGPFLIVSGVIVYLFGTHIIGWYKNVVLIGV